MVTCPGCSAAVRAGDLTCSGCGMPLDGSSVPTLEEGGWKRRSVRLPLPEEGRETSLFSPGELLAGRYRIAGFLGRGGMGEIYRVDDLRLGQTVALKFLPEWLAGDGAALARFHREVRLARQVSHPNVCRVFDVGEARGRPFLSMEYIDGEDLSSLLRRIGRFPTDKAVETARQICAGLAAIHEAGVLHRDLKPANVMIDARGRARIADFGVAALASELSRGEAKAGTPAYMAPEQISDGETSVRSDLYSLGLILYEVLTGRRPFEAPGRARGKPVAPSTLVADVDPSIERAILHCLEHDPRDRPASVLALVYAVTGGDPIAAALAAGETPSPEMVVASPKVGNLSRTVAGTCLAGVLLGLLGILLLSERVTAHRRVSLPNSPEALQHRAQGLLENLGYPGAGLDRAYGFEFDEEAYQYLSAEASSGRRKDLRVGLAKGWPPLYWFWCRQSPARSLWELEPANLSVEPGQPLWTTRGEAYVVLDPEGRLYRLEAVPDLASAGPGRPLDWDRLLRAAGYDPVRLAPVAPRLPSSYADHWAAWEGTFPEPSSRVPIRIEAASFRGVPVSFVVVGPWHTLSLPTPRSEFLGWFKFLSYLLVILVAAVQTRRNLRLGRGDQNGAWRLAMLVFGATLIGRLFGWNRSPRREEMDFLSQVLASALSRSALIWCFYMAVEPLVRRLWPQRIVSWGRLLAGHARDPLVGRDLLVGCLLGVGSVLTVFVRDLVAVLVGEWPHLRVIQPETLLGVRGVAQQLSGDVYLAIGDSLRFALLFLAVKLLVRERWTIVVFAGLLLGIALSTFAELSLGFWIPLVTAVVMVGLQLSVFLRFGLLADVTGRLVFLLAVLYPMTLDPSAWYSGTTLFIVLCIAGLAVYGFFISIAGRPWLRDAVVDG